MQYKYEFPGKEISFNSTHRISFDGFDAHEHRRILLDFTKSTWITPYGMILVYALAYHLREIHPDHPLEVRFCPKIFEYLCRMHLPQKLQTHLGVDVSPQPRKVKEQDRHDWLHELELIDLPDHYSADDAAERLFEIISANTQLEGEIQDIINIGLSELLDNIVSHSGVNQALIAAQSYSNCIRIGLGDLGIGIPARLRPVLGEEYEDKDLIQQSLNPKVTSRASGGETGLTDLRDSILGFVPRGALMIRSNTGWLWFTKGEPTTGEAHLSLSGTLIALLLKR